MEISNFCFYANDCCCSVTQLCHTLCNPMNNSVPVSPILHYLPEFTHSYPSSRWSHPIISTSVVPFSSCLQSSPASESLPTNQLFTSWSFSFRISPSNEYSGLNSFRIDWFGLFAVQGTLKKSSSAPQFESISSLVLSFFGPISHLYMTVGKTIALTIQTCQ